jgi:hypothetical protein
LYFNIANASIFICTKCSRLFTNVTFEKLNTVLVYESDDEACGAAFEGGPVALPYNKFSEQIKREVHTEYLDSIKPFKHGSRYAVPGEFVVAVGYKL